MVVALELVRHTLPFLVLNLTRCNPHVMLYSLCHTLPVRPVRARVDTC